MIEGPQSAREFHLDALKEMLSKRYTLRPMTRPSAGGTIPVETDNPAESVRMKATIHDPFDVSAGPHEDGLRARRAGMVHAFWIVLDADDHAFPSTMPLSEGGEAMAVFSSEDEARMFCRVRKEGTKMIVREISTFEVLLLLSGSPPKVKHVILDPIPEILGGKFSELLTLDTKRFARNFAGLGPMPVARTPYA